MVRIKVRKRVAIRERLPQRYTSEIVCSGRRSLPATNLLHNGGLLLMFGNYLSYTDADTLMSHTCS